MTKPIKITHKQHLFSHMPGTMCLIPGTQFALEVFPARIRLYDLYGPSRVCLKEVALELEGPINPFTVLQDLEKGEVCVFGKQRNGKFFFYTVDSTMTLFFKKGFGKKEKINLVKSDKKVLKPNPEALFLGKSKKQEWEKIKARKDLSEILPIWFRLGNFYQAEEYLLPESPMNTLFETCKEAMEKKEHDKLFGAFYPFFLAFFEKMLVPRLVDTEFQGIIPEEGREIKGSPLSLLAQASLLIRSLFIKEEKDSLSILPHLPSECFAGKMTKVQTQLGELDFEWTKKNMRRLVFKSKTSGEVKFTFPSHIKTFRIKNSLKERGRDREAHLPLSVEEGRSYFFDIFCD